MLTVTEAGQLEDARLLTLTLARMVTTSGKRYDLDDVVAGAGIEESAERARRSYRRS